jgi:hypothetical protein
MMQNTRTMGHAGLSTQRGVRGLTLLGLVLTFGVGCAFGEIRWNDPLQRQITLEDLQQEYVAMVRFGNFQRASGYVDPEFRDAYLERLPDPETMRFTDFEIGPIDINEELNEATSKVTYWYYRTVSPTEEKLVETQHWVRASGNSLSWMLRPEFDGLAAVSAR